MPSGVFSWAGMGWKLDARYNKTELIRRIRKIARYRSQITLTQIDAAVYIKYTLPQLPPRTFAYLDPPYYVKGEGLYEHFYQHSDHVRIVELVRALPNPWIVSYDAAVRLLPLYAGFERRRYNLSYSAGDRYKGTELIFFSDQLEAPGVPSSANIRISVVDRARIAALP